MQIDFDITQGDTLYVDIQPVDELDAPYDLTGYSATFGLEYVDAAGVAQNWTASSPAGITISVDGVLTVNVPPAVTAAIPAERRVTWQLRLTDPLGVVQTLASGRVRVRNQSIA